MSMDRSWLRRAYVSPAHFARTLPGVWLDREVTFARTEVVRDDYGSFSGSEVEYLTIMGHVRRDERAMETMSGADSIIRRQRLDIRIPWPADAEDIPKKGDFVSATLDTGTVRMHITDVKSPRGMSDHIHVVAEEYS